MAAGAAGWFVQRICAKAITTKTIIPIVKILFLENVFMFAGILGDEFLLPKYRNSLNDFIIKYDS